MNTIALLKEKGWEALDSLNIKRKYYPERKLSILNYDQINSPKFHPVVMECRSLIISDDFKIVSRAFDRFFNLGENKEDSLDWNKAVVLEKLDGSLSKLFYIESEKKWQLSTRGTLGEGNCGETGKSYVRLMMDAFFPENVEDNPFVMVKNLENLKLDTKFTYIFEFISPENRIVTPYEKAEMVLIGVRNNSSGEEEPLKNLPYFSSLLIEEGLKTRLPRYYKFQDLEEVKNELSKLKDLEEGFVVYDGKTRVKVKNPSYLVIHHSKGNKNLTDSNFLEMILTNETQEYLSYFPEKKERISVLTEKYEKFLKNLEEVYKNLSELPSQKDFALQAKKYKFSSSLFLARKNKISIFEAFKMNQLSHQVEQILSS